MRYALGIEYNGSLYHGWQRQTQVVSVQSMLDAAITEVAAHRVQTRCAGRTDHGVHALYQVAHFDTTALRNERAWLLGINRYLPPDIAVQWIKPVPDDFHARFSATARRYAYVIYHSPTRSALLHQQVTWVYRPLDIAAMAEAASYLVGTHDFSSFRAQGCQAKTTVRTVEHLHILEKPSILRVFNGLKQAKFLVIDIQANAFLHHMVRNIVGTLLSIGQGNHPPVWIKEILAARDRRLAAMTAPATGLYFCGVDYPVQFGLPVVRVML